MDIKIKKLLINGCSFVAGDAIVWDKFIQENNYSDPRWGSIDFYNDEKKILVEYRNNYIKKYYFPTMLSKELDVNFVDLSINGNSNDAIAMTTILYLLSLPEDDRKNFHVVIGWTALGRILKFSKKLNIFTTLLTNSAINDRQKKLSEELNLHYLALKDLYDEDFFSNYIKNIFLLENFLKANGITYTFYRSMGEMAICSKYNFESLFYPLSVMNVKVHPNNFTNDSCWFKFTPDSKYLGFESESLFEIYLKSQPHNRVSLNNWHPTLNVMTEVSKRISHFIKEKNYLNIL